MTKTVKRHIAFWAAVAMVMAMLLYFPSGTFSNIDFGLKASAEEITPSQPTKGDGSEGNPYQIGTAAELYWFAKYVNDGNIGINAVLTANITVNSGLEGKKGLLDSLEYDSDGNVSNGTSFTSWTPIGNSDINPYIGTFDGQNHTISGLYFNNSSTNNVGLFGYSYGTIKNVGVVDSYFKGSWHVGGVCGYNYAKNGTATIENCYNTGTVSGSDYVGGVCGENFADGEYAYGEEEATATETATIANCYNTGNVSGSNDVGGVCGYNSAYNIYFSGEEETATATATIANCYFDREVYTGNAVGYDYCTVSENVLGKDTTQFTSGEVAYLLSQGCTVGGTIYNGDVWGQDLSETTNYPVLDSTKKVYQNVSYSGCSLENQGDVTYVYANESAEPTYAAHSYVNGICTSCGGYEPATLNGTDNRYEIGNAGQLYWFAGLVNGTLSGVDKNISANAVLTADIDLSSKTFTSIGAEETNAFSGIFDGNGHKITVNQSGSEYVAIFGYIGACTIKNLTVTGTINTTEKYAAGIAMKKLGDETTANIENCISDVTIVSSVSGDGTHGGIIGNVDGTVNINNCAFTGKMEGSATTSCGGIIGWTQGSANITNSYVSASFGISSTSGNIVSRKGSNATVTVTNCYYLNPLNATQGSITQKTEEQFASGEVAYLLSQGCTVGEITYDGSVWGQKLGDNGDTYPVLKKELDEGNTVYQNIVYSGCSESNQGDTTYVYANNAADPVYADHTDGDEDGKCDTCSKYMDNIGARLVGHSLTLDGSVGVNFYMELSSEVISDSSAYMEFTLPGGKTSTVKVSEAPTEVISGTTYYKFKCQVNATAMTDTITAQIKSTVGNSKVYEYTVKEYADYLFAHKDESTEFAKAAELIEAMVNYGSYAQIYAGYNTEKLAVGDAKNLKSLDDVWITAYYEPSIYETKVQFAGANLSLLSTTTLRMYFQLIDVEANEVRFGYQGQLLEMKQSGDYYYVELVGIPASKLDDEFRIEVLDGSTIFVVTYTPMAYCTSVVHRETTETRTEDLKNLIKALVLYNRAADAYISEN